MFLLWHCCKNTIFKPLIFIYEDGQNTQLGAMKYPLVLTIYISGAYLPWVLPSFSSHLSSWFICQYCVFTVNASLWVKTLMYCSSHSGWVIPLSCPPLSSAHPPLFRGNRLRGCVERVTPPQAPLTHIKLTVLVCVRKMDLCKDQACWYYALTNKDIIIQIKISLEYNQTSKWTSLT